MTSAGRKMKEFYPNRIHVTCVAHGIHRICETLRDSFPDVKRLISCARKIFLKCPSRVLQYKEKLNCALPPDVIVTHWGTWITAAIFFANIFEGFSDLVSELRDDSAQVEKLKKLLQDNPGLPSNLAFINAHTASFAESITKLEKRGLSLDAQIQIVENLRTKIRTIPGRYGRLLQTKSELVFQKKRGVWYFTNTEHRSHRRPTLR